MCRTQHFYVLASWIDYVSVFALVKQNNMFVENSRTISTADYRKPLKYVLMERMFHQMWEETELISCQSFKLNCSALNLLDSRSTLRLTYEIEIQISKLGPRNIWLKYQIFAYESFLKFYTMNYCLFNPKFVIQYDMN